MVHVSVINRKQNLGVTQPLLATLEKENDECFPSFIKIKDNPEGDRCLINELVSYRLAKELDILMPESGVALIDEQTTDNTYTITDKSLGHCFYSTQIVKADKLLPSIMGFIDNKEMYEKTILFDHLIYNKDRNPGNILISYKKAEKVLYVIDHTHVFKNEAIWDANCLITGMKENDYQDCAIIDSSESYSLFASDKPITLKSLKSVASTFKEKCDIKLISKVVEDLPEDWLIPKDDIKALQQYLLYRVSYLDQICEMIVKRKGWKNE